MRLGEFVFSFIIGAFVMTALATTVGNAWFAPSVESYPEYRQALQEKVKAQQEANRLRFKLSELDLDKLRRSQRDPVNPAGPVIPAEDRIPVPAEPLPLPVNPNNKAEPTNPKDDVTDQPQPEEGEEDDMAEAKKSTAVPKSLGASLAIQSVNELVQLANVLFLGGANQIPGCGRPEAVAHVILAGAEVGLTPTQALSTIMLVGGKTTVYGDGALALVYASGLLDEIKEWSEGEGDGLTYFCKVKRKGETEPITRQFSVADAKKADLWEGGSKKKDNWIKFPKRMMTMRARGFALRDKFPDVLKGLAVWEEIVDSLPGGNVVNTEVRVLGPAVADPPASATAAPTVSEPTPEPKQLSASPAPAPDAPATHEQLAELARLHPLVMTAKDLIRDKLKAKAEWEQILAPYQVTSITKLTRGQADDLINKLGPAYDPFTYGQQAPQTSAA